MSLFDIDAGELHHAVPILDFRAHERRELLWFFAASLSSQGQRVVLHFLRLQDFRDFLLQPGHDRGRRACRHKDPVPAARLHAGESSFRRGRHFRQDSEPLAAGHRQAAQLE